MSKIRNLLNELVKNENVIKNTASKINKGLKITAIGAGGTIGGSTVLDLASEHGDKVEAEKALRKQERERRRKDTKEKGKDLAYMDIQEFEGYVQKLWDERSKHSRSWGGRVY